MGFSGLSVYSICSECVGELLEFLKIHIFKVISFKNIYIYIPDTTATSEIYHSRWHVLSYVVTTFYFNVIDNRLGRVCYT